LALEIRYSLRANEERMKLLEDIVEGFGEKKAKEINNKIDKVLAQVSTMPEMYRSSSRRKNLRKCVFNKQTSIYYRVKGKYIEIVSFRPNRDNPNSYKV
jgi:plasmid stabilization system protein ParE